MASVSRRPTERTRHELDRSPRPLPIPLALALAARRSRTAAVHQPADAVPVASWLAPVFLLRFSRSQRLRVSVPALFIVMSATVAVAMRNGFFPIAGGVDYVLFVVGLGLFGTVPYAVDRLLAPRLGVWRGRWSSRRPSRPSSCSGPSATRSGRPAAWRTRNTPACR